MPDSSSKLIRYSEILRLQVLDEQTLDPLGKVETLWMYPQINRVLGVICKPKLFGAKRLVLKLPQIKSVKTQILIEGLAEETTDSKVTQLESLIGTSVWSEDGDAVGQITDCLFDIKNGVIIRYLMVPEGQMPTAFTGFTDGVYLLSPKQIKSFSRQRVLISSEAVSELRLYSEGIRLKLAQMSEALKTDYWDGAAEEWDSFSQYLQSAALRAKDTFLTLAERAKAKAQALSQNLSQTVTEQVERLSEEDVFRKVLGQDQIEPFVPEQESQERGAVSETSESLSNKVIHRDVMEDDIFDVVEDGPATEQPFSRPMDWNDDQPDPWDDWDEDEAEKTVSQETSIDEQSCHSIQSGSQPITQNNEEISQATESSASPKKIAKNELDHDSFQSGDADDDPWIV